METEKLKNCAQTIERLDASCAERAWRLARGMLRHGADAEDAVQEAYVAVARNHQRVPVGDPWPWFAGVVANMCRRQRRVRRQERVAASQLLAEVDMRDASGDPLVTTIRREVQSELWSGLNALEAEVRDAVILVYASGLSQTEASKVAGIRRTTLLHRAERGLDQLRRRLGASHDSTRTLLQVMLVAPPSAGLAGAREVWKAGAFKAGVGVSAGMFGGLGVGVLTMKKSVAVVAVLLLLTGVGVWALGGLQVSDHGENEQSFSRHTTDSATHESATPSRRGARLPHIQGGSSSDEHADERISSPEILPASPDPVSSADPTADSGRTERATAPSGPEATTNFAVIRGRVVDETGKGIEGATVRLDWLRLTRPGQVMLDESERVEPRSVQSQALGAFILNVKILNVEDRDGYRFRLSVTGTGHYEYLSGPYLWKDDGYVYATGDDANGEVLKMTTLVLSSGTGRLSGRVVSAEGSRAPLQGVWVSLERQDNRGKRMTGPRAAIQTDAQGRYEFRDLPYGSYSLEASHLACSWNASRALGDQAVCRSISDFSPLDIVTPERRQAGAVISGKEPEVEKELSLWPPSELTFRLRHTKSDPTGVVQVMLGGRRDAKRGKPCETIMLMDVEPDASGVYRILNAATPESIALVVYADGFAPCEVDLTKTKKTREKGRFIIALDWLKLKRGASIQGLITTRDGAVLPKASVVCHPHSRTNGMQDVVPASYTPTVAPDGSYAIAGLPPGEYTLELVVSGCPAQSTKAVTIESFKDSLRVDFVLGDAHISGVIYVEEASLRGSRIKVSLRSLHERKPGNLMRCEVISVHGVEANPQTGAYVLSNVPEGRYVLFARCNEHFALSSPLTIEDTQDLSQNLRIESGGSLRGSVTLEGGKPLATVGVALVPTDLEFAGAFIVEGRTEFDGRYAIAYAPPGDYLVYAFHEAGGVTQIGEPTPVTIMSHGEAWADIVVRE